MNTIEINVPLLVSPSILDIQPPNIPIIDNHPHAVRLTVANINSCMLYPLEHDIKKRQQLILASYLWFLSEQKEQYITLENSVIHAIVNTPHIDIDSLARITNTNGQEAHIAGCILFFIHELHKAFIQKLTNKKPSLSKASYFAKICIEEEQRYKKKNKKKLPSSKDQLERYWYAYKPASHLWLAAWSLQETLRNEGDSRINSNKPLFFLLSDPSLFRKFFKISEYYRHFGETFSLDNTGPILGPNEGWRPTPNLELDGISLTTENKIYSGLQDLLARWEKRKKW